MTRENRQVLVLEDSATQAERLRILLESEGYGVTIARDGKEGLRRARAQRPDLVISDVIMPEMDGYAVCEELKSKPETKRIPIILFTERQEPGDILEGLLHGADNFIPKSSPDEYLLERVRRIFNQLEHRQRGGLEVEFVVRIGSRDVSLSADKQQIFELMISSLEETNRTNERLKESQRLLEERATQLAQLNAELETFSYSVSHDLRAPLRHIGGFASLLSESASSLGQAEQGYVARIASAVKHMTRLIDDLLSFSRLGRSEMRGGPVDLRGLIEEVVAELREHEPGRDVRVEVGPLPLVTGDRALLRVALTNLVSNAMKYTRKRARGEIEIGELVGNGDEVVVSIRDNGAGFDMRYADRLFGVFQRLHGDDEFEGTGIGLATVRRIVHRHGGRTWAEGAPDQGATFYLSLPRSR
jgi:signal transduction histidine kinase